MKLLSDISIKELTQEMDIGTKEIFFGEEETLVMEKGRLKVYTTTKQVIADMLGEH